MAGLLVGRTGGGFVGATSRAGHSMQQCSVLPRVVWLFLLFCTATAPKPGRVPGAARPSRSGLGHGSDTEQRGPQEQMELKTGSLSQAFSGRLAQQQQQPSDSNLFLDNPVARTARPSVPRRCLSSDCKPSQHSTGASSSAEPTVLAAGKDFLPATSQGPLVAAAALQANGLPSLGLNVERELPTHQHNTAQARPVAERSLLSTQFLSDLGEAFSAPSEASGPPNSGSGSEGGQGESESLLLPTCSLAIMDNFLDQCKHNDQDNVAAAAAASAAILSGSANSSQHLLPGALLDPQAVALDRMMYSCSTNFQPQEPVAVMSDTKDADHWAGFSANVKAYFNMTGITALSLEVPLDKMWVDAVFADLDDHNQTAKGSSWDALTISPMSIHELYHDYGILRPLDDLVNRADTTLQWARYSRYFRTVSAVFENRVLAIPITPIIPMMYYRKDILAKLGLNPPATWDDVIEVARLAHLQDSDGDGLQEYGFCMTRVPNCIDTAFNLATLWTPYQKVKGILNSLHFNITTMQPNTNSAAFKKAMEMLWRLGAYASPLDEQQKCNGTHGGWAWGRCAMVLSTSLNFKFTLFSGKPGMAENMGVVFMPGTTVVQGDNGELQACSSSVCPFAEMTTTASGDVQLVNHAPFVGQACLAMGINKRSPEAAQYASYRAISLASSPELLWSRLLSNSSFRAGPVLEEMTDLGQLDRWTSAGFPAESTAQFLRVFKGQLDHINQVMSIRLPLSRFYYEIMSAAVLNVTNSVFSTTPSNGSSAGIGSSSGSSSNNSSNATTQDPALALASPSLGQSSSDPGVADSAPGSGSSNVSQWIQVQQAMDSQLRAMYASHADKYSLQVLQLEYWAQVGYTPPNPPRPPSLPPPSADSSSANSALIPGVVSGVVVGAVALALAAALLFWTRRKGRAYGGFKVARAKGQFPGLGPETTLVVTDVENSTVLWEQLDPQVMGSAMRLHHECVRQALRTHRGYETATEGDSFILAFHCPQDAVQFALELQSKLVRLDWPPQLLLQPGCEPVPASGSASGAAALPAAASGAANACVKSSHSARRGSQKAAAAKAGSTAGSIAVSREGSKGAMTRLSRGLQGALGAMLPRHIGARSNNTGMDPTVDLTSSLRSPDNKSSQTSPRQTDQTWDPHAMDFDSLAPSRAMKLRQTKGGQIQDPGLASAPSPSSDTALQLHSSNPQQLYTVGSRLYSEIQPHANSEIQPSSEPVVLPRLDQGLGSSPLVDVEAGSALQQLPAVLRSMQGSKIRTIPAARSSFKVTFLAQEMPSATIPLSAEVTNPATATAGCAASPRDMTVSDRIEESRSDVGALVQAAAEELGTKGEPPPQQCVASGPMTQGHGVDPNQVGSIIQDPRSSMDDHGRPHDSGQVMQPAAAHPDESGSDHESVSASDQHPESEIYMGHADLVVDPKRMNPITDAPTGSGSVRGPWVRHNSVNEVAASQPRQSAAAAAAAGEGAGIEPGSNWIGGKAKRLKRIFSMASLSNGSKPKSGSTSGKGPSSPASSSLHGSGTASVRSAKVSPPSPSKHRHSDSATDPAAASASMCAPRVPSASAGDRMVAAVAAAATRLVPGQGLEPPPGLDSSSATPAAVSPTAQGHAPASPDVVVHATQSPASASPPRRPTGAALPAALALKESRVELAASIGSAASVTSGASTASGSVIGGSGEAGGAPARSARSFTAGFLGLGPASRSGPHTYGPAGQHLRQDSSGRMPAEARAHAHRLSLSTAVAGGAASSAVPTRAAVSSMGAGDLLQRSPWSFSDGVDVSVLASRLRRARGGQPLLGLHRLATMPRERPPGSGSPAAAAADMHQHVPSSTSGESSRSAQPHHLQHHNHTRQRPHTSVVLGGSSRGSQGVAAGVAHAGGVGPDGGGHHGHVLTRLGSGVLGRSLSHRTIGSVSSSRSLLLHSMFTRRRSTRRLSTGSLGRSTPAEEDVNPDPDPDADMDPYPGSSHGLHDSDHDPGQHFVAPQQGPSRDDGMMRKGGRPGSRLYSLIHSRRASHSADGRPERGGLHLRLGGAGLRMLTSFIGGGGGGGAGPAALAAAGGGSCHAHGPAPHVPPPRGLILKVHRTSGSNHHHNASHHHQSSQHPHPQPGGLQQSLYPNQHSHEHPASEHTVVGGYSDSSKRSGVLGARLSPRVSEAQQQQQQQQHFKVLEGRGTVTSIACEPDATTHTDHANGLSGGGFLTRIGRRLSALLLPHGPHGHASRLSQRGGMRSDDEDGDGPMLDPHGDEDAGSMLLMNAMDTMGSSMFPALNTTTTICQDRHSSAMLSQLTPRQHSSVLMMSQESDAPSSPPLNNYDRVRGEDVTMSCPASPAPASPLLLRPPSSAEAGLRVRQAPRAAAVSCLDSEGPSLAGPQSTVAPLPSQRAGSSINGHGHHGLGHGAVQPRSRRTSAVSPANASLHSSGATEGPLAGGRSSSAYIYGGGAVAGCRSSNATSSLAAATAIAHGGANISGSGNASLCVLDTAVLSAPALSATSGRRPKPHTQPPLASGRSGAMGTAGSTHHTSSIKSSLMGLYNHMSSHHHLSSHNHHHHHHHHKGGDSLHHVFRGLRVRVGIHCGLNPEMQDRIAVHRTTHRATYSGPAMALTKALADCAHAGSVVATGATMRALQAAGALADLEALAARHLGKYMLGDACSESPHADVFVLINDLMDARAGLLPPGLRKGTQLLPGVEGAPTGPSVTLGLVHAVGLQALQDSCNPHTVLEALHTFQQTLLHLAKAHGGHMVRCGGGVAMAAFALPQPCLNWLLEVQSALLQADWPHELLSHELGEQVVVDVVGPGGDVTQHVIYRGLRVKATADLGWVRGGSAAPTCRALYGPTRMYKRVERLMRLAHAGQVLCTQEVQLWVQSREGGEGAGHRDHHNDTPHRSGKKSRRKSGSDAGDPGADGPASAGGAAVTATAIAAAGGSGSSASAGRGHSQERQARGWSPSLERQVGESRRRLFPLLLGKHHQAPLQPQSPVHNGASTSDAVAGERSERLHQLYGRGRGMSEGAATADLATLLSLKHGSALGSEERGPMSQIHDPEHSHPSPTTAATASPALGPHYEQPHAHPHPHAPNQGPPRPHPPHLHHSIELGSEHPHSSVLLLEGHAHLGPPSSHSSFRHASPPHPGAHSSSSRPSPLDPAAQAALGSGARATPPTPSADATTASPWALALGSSGSSGAAAAGRTHAPATATTSTAPSMPHPCGEAEQHSLQGVVHPPQGSGSPAAVATNADTSAAAAEAATEVGYALLPLPAGSRFTNVSDAGSMIAGEVTCSMLPLDELVAEAATSQGSQNPLDPRPGTLQFGSKSQDVLDRVPASGTPSLDHEFSGWSVGNPPVVSTGPCMSRGVHATAMRPLSRLGSASSGPGLDLDPHPNMSSIVEGVFGSSHGGFLPLPPEHLTLPGATADAKRQHASSQKQQANALPLATAVMAWGTSATATRRASLGPAPHLHPDFEAATADATAHASKANHSEPLVRIASVGLGSCAAIPSSARTVATATAGSGRYHHSSLVTIGEPVDSDQTSAREARSSLSLAAADGPSSPGSTSCIQPSARVGPFTLDPGSYAYGPGSGEVHSHSHSLPRGAKRAAPLVLLGDGGNLLMDLDHENNGLDPIPAGSSPRSSLFPMKARAMLEKVVGAASGSSRLGRGSSTANSPSRSGPPNHLHIAEPSTDAAPAGIPSPRSAPTTPSGPTAMLGGASQAAGAFLMPITGCATAACSASSLTATAAAAAHSDRGGAAAGAGAASTSASSVASLSPARWSLAQAFASISGTPHGLAHGLSHGSHGGACTSGSGCAGQCQPPRPLQGQHSWAGGACSPLAALQQVSTSTPLTLGLGSGSPHNSTVTSPPASRTGSGSFSPLMAPRMATAASPHRHSLAGAGGAGAGGGLGVAAAGAAPSTPTHQPQRCRYPASASWATPPSPHGACVAAVSAVASGPSSCNTDLGQQLTKPATSELSLQGSGPHPRSTRSSIGQRLVIRSRSGLAAVLADAERGSAMSGLTEATASIATDGSMDPPSGGALSPGSPGGSTPRRGSDAYLQHHQRQQQLAAAAAAAESAAQASKRFPSLDSAAATATATATHRLSQPHLSPGRAGPGPGGEQLLNTEQYQGLRNHHSSPLGHLLLRGATAGDDAATAASSATAPVPAKLLRKHLAGPSPALLADAAATATAAAAGEILLQQEQHGVLQPRPQALALAFEPCNKPGGGGALKLDRSPVFLVKQQQGHRA